MPNAGTYGTSGTLKDLGRFGSVFLRIITPRETIENAINVPIFAICAALFTLRNNVPKATNAPTAIVTI